MIREAVANQIIHGNNGNATLQSDIHLIIDRECNETGIALLSCVLLIHDHSPPFDPSQVPDPAAEENREKTTGRGLMFIQEVGRTKMFQFPLENFDKTIVYSWNEHTAVPATDDSDERSAKISDSSEQAL